MANLASISHRFLSIAFATALLTGGGTVAGIAFGDVPAAVAQTQDQPSGPATPPPGAHRHRMGQLLMSLNLSDAQKTQIRSIMADARKQNENVTDRDQRHANMKAALAKAKAVLTPAQRTELQAKMDAMQQQPAAHAQ